MAILLPPDPPADTDPVAALIKRRRRELGLTLDELARRARVKSRSYIHHIENGDKVPDEEIAARIARALGEDEETFRAWARIRSGRTMLWDEAVRSMDRLRAEAIANVQRDPRHEVIFALLRRTPESYPAREQPPRYLTGSPSRGGWKPNWPPEDFPVLRYGADPGNGGSEMAIEGHIRLDPDTVASTPQLQDRLHRLERPFAYRLTPAHARRFRKSNILPPTFFAVVTRSILPIDPHEVYVVRTAHGIELGYLRWDGRRLLLMPSDDQPDFEVWDAPGSRELGRIVAGKIALLLPHELVTAT